MLKYTIQDDDSQSAVPTPGSVDPTAGKVAMNVVFTDKNGNNSAAQYFEVDSLDPEVIDSALKDGAIAYNETIVIAEAQAAFDDPFDTLPIGEPVEFDDDGTIGEGSISGMVFADLDEDGIRGEGDDVGPDITVELYHAASGSLVDTQVTDEEGLYSFTNVEGADYYVKFITPEGYAITLQDQGADDAVDSDANPATGITATFTLENDAAVTGIDAGMYEQDIAHITGTLFDDWDRDGVYDSAGFVETTFNISTLVEVRNVSDDELVASETVTGGTYDIGVPSGEYYVKVTPPTDYELSPDTSDSDIDPTTLESEGFEIASGATVTKDCGLMHELGYVDAHVFVDDGAGGGTGDNGVQDGTELDWITGGGVFLRVTHPLGGFNDAYPEIADGTIHLQVRSGTGLSAEWIFVDAYETGYHITGGTNPQTINVTANSTTDLGDRGVAAD